MSEYRQGIQPIIKHYIDAFLHDYEAGDCDFYFIKSGGRSVYLDACCQLFFHFQEDDHKGILSDAQTLALECAEHHMPYIILHYILEHFRNKILCDLLEEEHSAPVISKFLKKTHVVSDRISKHYLSIRIEKFLENNHRRIKTIEELADTKSIHFFEGHLIWLDKLAQAISTLNTALLPELSATECVLGRWLQYEGRVMVTDEQQWQHLEMLHLHLHLIAKRVKVLLGTTPIDYNYLLLLLEKADHLSLSIGIDLTLISNMEYIKFSSKDPLTGLLNRQFLDKIFKTQFELSKTLDTGFALIMADIDDFKQVNDRYGHVFGDVVLKAFANVMTASTRRSDFVIRFGGEEFILILPVTTLGESKAIAEKICSAFATRGIQKDDKQLYFSASFGVSYIHPGEDETSSQRHISELIDEVDQKLLMAKQLGKNRVVF
ncbi:sensor domain-containing diguanylate cyclase [bacterium]|nr:sensor domain-containing diguanylate cyclase [bacterium]